MMSRKKIDVFTSPQQTSGGCSCSCSCNSTQTISVDELKQRFETKYSEVGDITIIDHAETETTAFLHGVNSALQNNGEKLSISTQNMGFVLPKLLPLIVVDGKIFSVKNHPDEDALYNAIVTGKPIPTQQSCC
jgi:hypothetical protein